MSQKIVASNFTIARQPPYGFSILCDGRPIGKTFMGHGAAEAFVDRVGYGLSMAAEVFGRGRSAGVKP